MARPANRVLVGRLSADFFGTSALHADRWTTTRKEKPRQSWRGSILHFAPVSFGADSPSVRGEMGSVRGEMGSVRGEMGSVRGEMGSVRGEMGSVRGEMGSVRTDGASERTEAVSLSAEAVSLSTDGPSVRPDSPSVPKEMGSARPDTIPARPLIRTLRRTSAPPHFPKHHSPPPDPASPLHRSSMMRPHRPRRSGRQAELPPNPILPKTHSQPRQRQAALHSCAPVHQQPTRLAPLVRGLHGPALFVVQLCWLVGIEKNHRCPVPHHRRTK
jgi:hypothetical protein